jgi:hypothetical protein
MVIIYIKQLDFFVKMERVSGINKAIYIKTKEIKDKFDCATKIW